METNIIYNEDCLETMFGGHIDEHSRDIVLTSPPYNISRSSSKEAHTHSDMTRIMTVLPMKSTQTLYVSALRVMIGFSKRTVVCYSMFRTQVKTLHWCGILFQIYREGLLSLFQTALYGKRRTQYRIM